MQTFSTNLSLLGLAGVLLLTGCPRDKAPLVVQTEPETVPVVYERLTVIPASTHGQTVQGHARVTDVISDRGFWITDDHGTDEVDPSQKMFVVIREDVPQTEMIDIDVGDRLELTGIVMNADDMDQLQGTLEQDTRDAIASDERFLATHWRWTRILDADEDEDAHEDAMQSAPRVGSDDFVIIRSKLASTAELDPHFLVLDFERWNDGDFAEDSTIDRSEFHRGLAGLQYRIFAGFDDDESGAIDPTEFRSAMVDLVSPDNGPVQDSRFDRTLADWYDGFEESVVFDWDTNGNGELERSELSTVLEDDRLFATWDDDADGMVERDEYTNNLFDTWDDNDDGVLTRAEFRSSASLWYSEFGGQGDFDSWAGNEEGEPADAIANTPEAAGANRLSDAWDTDDDGTIERSEYLAGIRHSWDANLDGDIERWEWDLAWLGDSLRGDFEAWDTTNDGRISKTEFDRVATLEAPFGRWDIDEDGSLSDGELRIAINSTTAVAPEAGSSPMKDR